MFGRRHTPPLVLTVEARQADLARIRAFVRETLATTTLSAKACRDLRLAVDEACANVVEHAYAGRQGPLRVEIDRRRDRVAVTLIDQGRPFDAGRIEQADTGPDLGRYVKTGKKGGLGLFLIRKLADEVEYVRHGDENRLILVRRIPRPRILRLPQRLLQLLVPRVSSLKLRFILQSGLVLVVLVCATYLYMRERQHVVVKRTVLAGGVALGAELGARAADLLLKPAHFGPKQTRLIAAARRAIDRPDVELVVIIDHEGMVWAASDEEMIFQSFTPPVDGVEVSPGSDMVPEQVADGAPIVDGCYWIKVPATLPAAAGDAGQGALHYRLGTTYVALSAAHVAAVIDAEEQTLLLVCVLVLGVGLGAVVLLISVVVGPIQRLTDGVRAVGSGHQQRLEELGLKEIDGIARAFNEVTDRFQEAQVSLVEKERLEQEMEVAQSIQHSLLPAALPDMLGYEVGTFYRAAKEVGGDYYDLVRVGEDAWGLAVADVSGKGVPGSLVMMMIRTALRLEAQGERAADEVLDRVNSFVSGDMKRGMFVTMFYVVLDSTEREISYASAGHNPMVLYRGETDQTYFLNPKGFPVGIDLPDPSQFGRAICSERVSLNRDDLLVIYTDGITEAMNEQMEQYGMERFLAAIKRWATLKPDEFCTRLEQDLAAWTGDAAQSDDMTLVAIKERLASDDLKVEAREQLLDLVAVEGLSVAEACQRAKVSTSTFYRLRRLRAASGRDGLRVHRRRAELGRLSHEDELVLVELVRESPDLGATRLAPTLGQRLGREVKPHRIAEALRRLGLNRRVARRTFADAERRHQQGHRDGETRAA